MKLTELLIHFYDSIFYYKHHTKELLRENHKWKLHYLLFPGGHRMHISTTTAFALLLIDYQGGPGGRCEWLKSQWKLPELRRSVKITMSVLTDGYLHNKGSSVKELLQVFGAANNRDYLEPKEVFTLAKV